MVLLHWWLRSRGRGEGDPEGALLGQCRLRPPEASRQTAACNLHHGPLVIEVVAAKGAGKRGERGGWEFGAMGSGSSGDEAEVGDPRTAAEEIREDTRDRVNTSG